jgi:hypothetical protein
MCAEELKVLSHFRFSCLLILVGNSVCKLVKQDIHGMLNTYGLMDVCSLSLTV